MPQLPITNSRKERSLYKNHGRDLFTVAFTMSKHWVKPTL